MVEAKVDIRKLQLLNDRIAQVTDALNQVRLSVHGLTHTGLIGQPFAGVPFGISQAPYAPFGFPQQIPNTWGQPMGFQHTPFYASPPGVASFGQVPWQAGLQWPGLGGFGLQHTGAYAPQSVAYPPFGQGLVGQIPAWGIPAFGGGLSHSPELMEQRVVEQRVNDPNRILQTFPYCLAPLSSAATW